MSRSAEEAEDRHVTVAVALVGLAALLPFLRGLLSGQSFFFRDLSVYFFPVRRFVVEGLLQGEVRYWSPLLHEGKQEVWPAISYPLDLLQVFLPDERGFTILLALHVPLAALSFFALARGMGMCSLAAAGGGLVYGLGGFGLSLINLYDNLPAAAWAPLFILGLRRVAEGRPAAVAGTGAVFAVMVSTCRVEILLQTFVLALVLLWPQTTPGTARRGVTALLLGTALSAPVWIVVAGVIARSERGVGLSTQSVLAHSIHPLTLLQTVIANLHGDLLNPVGRWWGDRFCSGGFPYFISFYLGATVVALSILGATRRWPWRTGLLCLVAIAVWLGLGAYGGWEPVFRSAAFLRRVRYPSKAFYTIHTAVALFTAAGLDNLWRASARSKEWSRFALAGLVLGGALVLLPSLIGAGPWRGDLFRWFFPEKYLDFQREATFRSVVWDAATGGAVALAAVAIAALVRTARLGPGVGATAVVALLTADLLRAGSGINPMVTPAFFDFSPETTTLVRDLNSRGGRVYTCDVPTSRAYQDTRPPQAEDRDVQMFRILRETLTPSFNVPTGPPSAYSTDLTRVVPGDRTLAPQLRTCVAVPAILGRLRAAGVSHVLSLDPLAEPDLRLEQTIRPGRIAPLAVHVYALTGSLPLRALAARVMTAPDKETATARAAEPGFQEAGGAVVEGAGPFTGSPGTMRAEKEAPNTLAFGVDSEGPGMLVIRDAFAPGWRASVNGVETPILRADGRHRAVPVPAGHSRVEMTYRPPGYSWGLVLFAGGLLGIAVSASRDRGSARAPLEQATGRANG